MAEKPGNDGLDLDAIQAQMDLTMAHAHELATSWINPSLRSSGTDVFKELEEYMRRPPRLGVGAPIPENAAASRQEARLKHRLTKASDEKKRTKEKKLENQNQDSSDVEESRASSIKKKVKLDAFRVSWDGKKTKAKAKDTTATLLPRSPRAGAKRPLEEEDSESDDIKDVEMMTVPSFVELSKKSRRRLRRRLRLDQLGRSSGQPTAPAAGPSSLGGDPRLRNGKRIPISQLGTRPGKVHKLPLLNLDGPPKVRDDDAVSDNSTKKRRKRRHKRRK